MGMARDAHKCEVDMNQHRDSDLTPFRDYCRANGIGISTGYRLVSDGKLRLTKINSRSYISREDREAFLNSLKESA
jgi:predicted site-specific integrase-resolvase